MRSFRYSEIKNRLWDSDILGLIAAFYKEAGKQELYLKQQPEKLEKLVEIAKVQSTEASNAIEGIVTSDERIAAIVNHDSYFYKAVSCTKCKEISILYNINDDSFILVLVNY